MSMPSRIFAWSLTSAVLSVPLVVSCSAPLEGNEGGDLGTGGVGGTPANGGATVGGAGASAGGASGAAVTGGASGASVTGGASGAGLTGGVGGTPSGGAAGVPAGAAGISGAAGTGVAGAGGAPTGGAGMGGAPAGAGGTMGVAGSFVGGGSGGMPTVPALNCGGKGTALENHGPTTNRVNYVIVADGYTDAQLAQGGTLDTHLTTYMNKRFTEQIGQPYLRYRNFVNICVLRIASTPICGSSTFGCCGSDSSRLATCNSTSVNNAIRDNLPTTFEVDWRAVVLNGSSWWNTGSSLMLWSGGNQDAAGAALHEGGHGFHQLADEYGSCTGANCGSNTMGTGTSGTNYNEVNSCGNPATTDNKWTAWIGFTQTGATGLQGTWSGSRYVGSGQYRPSANSMMNSLFGNNVNTSFNTPSREKMVFDIWRIISNPWDSVTPPAGAVTNPTTLSLQLIDAAVINVDWSVDGQVVARNGGPTYNIGAAGLAPGSHMVQARAYDNAGMDLVRQTTGTTFNRQYWASNAQNKTVTWTVTIQ
jgi:hypothetical protein